jgi:hypothetical protein
MAARFHRLPEPLVSVTGRLSALTQAVSYHVTPRADMQPLGNRGNAALGSYVLLHCLVCGVKKIGSLMACQRHRPVAQPWECMSADRPLPLWFYPVVLRCRGSYILVANLNRHLLQNKIEAWSCSSASLV